MSHRFKSRSGKFGRALSSTKQGLLSLQVDILLESTTVTKKLVNISLKTKISSLKILIEQDLGILPEMYTLSYLDACPLLEKSSLQENFVVNGATLQLRPWRQWEDLLLYAYLGDHELCLQTMHIRGPTEWNKYCAWAALYIASHQGHYLLVANLLEKTGATINSKSPCGWTALHASARTGQWKVLCILLDKGADVRLRDANSLTAFDLARKHGHKKCENSLNFCQWNLQKHYIVQERNKEHDPTKARRTAARQSHLQMDSTLTPWLHGTQGQLYMAQLSNPVSIKEVATYKPAKEDKVQFPSIMKTKDDTFYSSLKTKTPSVPKTPDIADEDTLDNDERFDFDYGWFDTLRAQQLIPSTNDILTYANPSSNSLRPRSLLNPEGYTTPIINFRPIPTIPRYCPIEYQQ